MKTLFKLTGGIYCVTMIGSVIYMIADPEGYGRMLGKITHGIFKELDVD